MGVPKSKLDKIKSDDTQKFSKEDLIREGISYQYLRGTENAQDIADNLVVKHYMDMMLLDDEFKGHFLKLLEKHNPGEGRQMLLAEFGMGEVISISEKKRTQRIINEYEIKIQEIRNSPDMSKDEKQRKIDEYHKLQEEDREFYRGVEADTKESGDLIWEGRREHLQSIEDLKNGEKQVAGLPEFKKLTAEDLELMSYGLAPITGEETPAEILKVLNQKKENQKTEYQFVVVVNDLIDYYSGLLKENPDKYEDIKNSIERLEEIKGNFGFPYKYSLTDKTLKKPGSIRPARRDKGFIELESTYNEMSLKRKTELANTGPEWQRKIYRDLNQLLYDQGIVDIAEYQTVMGDDLILNYERYGKGILWRYGKLGIRPTAQAAEAAN